MKFYRVLLTVYDYSSDTEVQEKGFVCGADYVDAMQHVQNAFADILSIDGLWELNSENMLCDDEITEVFNAEE